MKHICIISSIFHGFGKIGGYGAMARSLAQRLIKNGYKVSVVVPRRKGQKKITQMDGFTVYGLGRIEMIRPSFYKKIDADLYHSQSPNLMSTAAMIAQPHKKHIITCRDPRNFKDWFIELKDATWKRRLRNIPIAIFEEGPLIKWTVKHADAVAYAACYIKDKIKCMYGLKDDPTFLPNIQPTPKAVPKKAKNPTVCFVGRLDKRKRPEIFIELAKDFPQVTFLVVGVAEEKQRQHMLEKQAKKYKNVKMLGFVDKFTQSKELYDIYSKSWVMINTASREAYPLTFMEAMSRGCALISHVNPDNAPEKFGYWAEHEDFAKGLNYVLEKDRWKELGEKAHKYIMKTYEDKKSTQIHLNLYKEVLEGQK